MQKGLLVQILGWHLITVYLSGGRSVTCCRPPTDLTEIEMEEVDGLGGMGKGESDR